MTLHSSDFATTLQRNNHVVRAKYIKTMGNCFAISDSSLNDNGEENWSAFNTKE